MSDVKVSEVNYGDYGKCVNISNGDVEVVVTVDVGPRIIRYGFVGGANEFCEGVKDEKPIGDGKVWRIKGGHRLWHSPESLPRSYMPDDEPVCWSRIDSGIAVTQKVEPWVQIKKEMEITLCKSCNSVKVVHKLTNKNAWPVELSVWGLSVMAPGGKEVVPHPDRDTGLLGNRVLALWPYTKMNDHRVYWGDKYIVLDQDPNMKAPFKFGIPNEYGWVAYFNHGNLFIKKYTHKLGAKYPDFGVSYETYTTDFMTEMESLSPLTKLNPDESVCHVEEWDLIKGVDKPSNDEKEIDSIIKKYIK